MNDYSWAIDRLQDMLDEADQSFDIEALELAIRSLEAWKEIKTKLKRKQIDIHVEAFKHGYENLFENGMHSAFVEALEIIDKHLIEGTTLEIEKQYLGGGRT